MEKKIWSITGTSSFELMGTQINDPEKGTAVIVDMFQQTRIEGCKVVSLSTDFAA